MKRAMLVGCLLSLGLLACEQKPKPEEHTVTTAAAAPAEPAPANDKAGTPTTEPATEKVAEDTQEIPTSIDFEEQAEQAITPATLEQELNSLDKEIAQATKPTVVGLAAKKSAP